MSESIVSPYLEAAKAACRQNGRVSLTIIQRACGVGYYVSEGILNRLIAEGFCSETYNPILLGYAVKEQS